MAGRTVEAELRATLDRPDVDPVQALTEVEANVHSGFLTIDRELSRPAGEQPSAALALAALQGNTLHLIGIADCRIIYEARTGEIGEFNPSEAAWLKPSLSPSGAGLSRNIQAKTLGPPKGLHPNAKGACQSRRRVLCRASDARLEQPRKARNHKAGNIRHLLLVSDGLYRLVDVFGTTTAAGLMERALAQGLLPLYSELRGLELADADCSDYPRVKAHDDASAILVALTE